MSGKVMERILWWHANAEKCAPDRDLHFAGKGRKQAGRMVRLPAFPGWRIRKGATWWFSRHDWEGKSL